MTANVLSTFGEFVILNKKRLLGRRKTLNKTTPGLLARLALKFKMI